MQSEVLLRFPNGDTSVIWASARRGDKSAQVTGRVPGTVLMRRRQREADVVAPGAPAAPGDTVTLVTEGPQADDAFQAIKDMIDEKFQED